MRVLFVDDEPRVLEAIERLFFDLDVDWETCFASSVDKALGEIHAAPVDVIVCDMRMPGQDSATLLNRVCEINPRIVRIVLSGQTDEAAALRVVPVAHQFLSKPCDASTLRRVIENTREVRELLDDAKLQALVGQVGHLPSPPKLFARAVQAAGGRQRRQRACGGAGRARPSHGEQAVASRQLGLVRGLQSGFSDVRTAVLRLGTRTLRNLALGIGAFEAARGAAGALSGFIDELQSRSLRIARVAKELSEKPNDADAAFMAGLVCDLGQLVLATVAPERRREAEAEVQRSGVQAPSRARAVGRHARRGRRVLARTVGAAVFDRRGCRQQSFAGAQRS
ncbi:MAG: response regulator [Polyangiaceae bacterium]